MTLTAHQEANEWVDAEDVHDAIAVRVSKNVVAIRPG